MTLQYPEEVRADKWNRTALNKDRVALAETIDLLEKEIEESFDRTRVALLRELETEKKKAHILLRKLQKQAEASLNHLDWAMERNKIFRKKLHKEYETQLKMLEERGLSYEDGEEDSPEEESKEIWFGLDTAMSVLYRVSTGEPGGIRNLLWEKASYAFLVDGLFSRALKEESQGYFTASKLPEKRISELVDQTLQLLPVETENWSRYSLDIKDLWVEFILPEVYGGTDPNWAETDPWELAAVNSFMERKEDNPTFYDTLQTINTGKFS